MAWQAYITAGTATGDIEQMCILDFAGNVQAEGGLNGQQFHPCGYAGKTTKDDGTEAAININEQADVANFLSKGKKPPTGIRFYGVKYFCVGGTPRTESDGIRKFISGKGPGCFLAVCTTNKYVIVARGTTANGHSAPGMNDHVLATAATLVGHGY
jgi:hypothetical protein